MPNNLPGVDLLPVATGEKKLERKYIFGESFAHDVADVDNPQASLLYRWVIHGRWKLLLTYDGEVNRYKPVHLREEKRPQLFDLIADPYEMKNLAEANPDIVADLVNRIDSWWKVDQRQVETVFAAKDSGE